MLGHLLLVKAASFAQDELQSCDLKTRALRTASWPSTMDSKNDDASLATE